MRLVERKRAQRMAEGLAEAVSGGGTVLAVIELERARDVTDILKGGHLAQK